MKSNNKIADIELAIEKWKNSCEEKGENPVAVAIFTSSKPAASNGEMWCVVVGEGEDTISLLRPAIQAAASSMAEKPATS